ncbi:MAG TPA: RES domain-containing protein, partial [Vicinamibacteria bacterium]|nr:RES domain-containing protein [Vicinamibacteria bacterium]
WSHALWAHSSQPDGIWYAARHDPTQRSLALFDRAAAAVTVVRLTGLMDGPQRTSTAQVIHKYGFTLLP